MDKNICGYCGYMGLNSLVDFRPDTGCRRTLFPQCRKHPHARQRARILQHRVWCEAHQQWIDAPPQQRRDL